MGDTSSMLQTWGEENDEHAGEPNGTERAEIAHPPGDAAWFVVLVERVSVHLGCEASTLMGLVNAELGIRELRRPVEQSAPREGAVPFLAKLLYERRDR